MLAILISRMNSLFSKNIVYKMTQARYHPIFQNIIRILLCLGMHICVSFFNCWQQCCLFWDVKRFKELRYHVFKKCSFYSKAAVVPLRHIRFGKKNTLRIYQSSK